MTNQYVDVNDQNLQECYRKCFEMSNCRSIRFTPGFNYCELDLEEASQNCISDGVICINMNR